MIAKKSANGRCAPLRVRMVEVQVRLNWLFIQKDLEKLRTSPYYNKVSSQCH